MELAGRERAVQEHEESRVNKTESIFPGRVIWVIDDDATALGAAVAQLEPLGFRVKTFTDARRALELLPAVAPDLIVLDVMMPGEDGFECCRQVRGMPARAGLPILMMTARDNAEAIHQALEAGATDFALKPVDWKLEAHRLRTMLRAADTARELRRTEQDMRQAQDSWERTFNAITDVVTVLDRDLRVVRANAFTSDVLNKPLSEIVGRPCYALFRDRTQPCEDCPVQRAFLTGSAQSREMPYGRSGGEWLVTGSPMADRDGRVFQVVHVAHDLTQRKQLEERYREAQKLEAVGTLAGGIAHEFNNLLQVILAWSELLHADAEGSEATSATQAIMDAAKRGRTLSEQLLTFSRRGTQKPDRKLLDLNKLAEELVGVLPRILPKAINLELELPRQPVLVQADAAQIQQVVLNLAANASQAMPEGGALRLRIRTLNLEEGHRELPPESAPGTFALLEVADTGHGMDRRTLGRIFDPFFTTRTVGQGTGLGLSIVYGIVRDHGGHILVESEPGRGACFRVYLPSLVPEPVATEEEVLGGEEEVEARSAEGVHILVVDDEASIRQMLHRFLSRRGWTVSMAGSGEEALALFEAVTTKPDLVILDVGMPGMGGIRCLEALRALDPQVRVLIATGYGLEEVSESARRLGAVGVLSKPYELKQLTQRIRSLLHDVVPLEPVDP